MEQEKADTEVVLDQEVVKCRRAEEAEGSNSDVTNPENERKSEDNLKQQLDSLGNIESSIKQAANYEIMSIDKNDEPANLAETTTASQETEGRATSKDLDSSKNSEDKNLQNKNAEDTMIISQEIHSPKTTQDPLELNKRNSVDQSEDIRILATTSQEGPPNINSMLYPDPNPDVEGNFETDSDTTSEADSDAQVPQNRSNYTEPTVTVQRPLLNTGLGAIASEYHSDSEAEDDESSDSLEIVNAEMSLLQHRNPNVIISSDSDSDIEVVSQTNAPPKVIEIDDDDDENNGKPKGPIRVKGELLLEDLPPIQDLHITVPEEECAVLGKIHSIVEQLVLVDCLPGTAALDLDTILFLDKGHKVLGEVFDVIGQVASPLYCVRFNSNKQIKEKGIEVGETVYVAPRTEHTRFIILPDLMTIRGSDASWEDDVEPPEKHLDYSDDEEERNAKRASKSKKQQGDETDTPKRPKSSPRPPNQQSRVPRQRFQGTQQYSSPGPDTTPVQTSRASPFQYDATNTTWHANYNYPPPLFYPNPYARPQFNSPGNRQNYGSPNFPQPQFSSPNSSMPQFASPNQQSPQYPINPTSPQLIPPNMHLGADYSRAPFMHPHQPQTSFSPPNQHNQTFMPPNQQFSPTQNRPQFASPGYRYRPFFPPPPPPPQ